MERPLKNTILGINISHDTSIAVVKDGVLVDVFEEERCRRKKYWAPKSDEKTLLQSIEQKIDTDSIDEVVFTSFDRRDYNYTVPKELREDRLATREFAKEFTKRQHSRERIEELAEQFELEFTHAPNQCDSIIMDDIITEQFGKPRGEFLYNIKHHLHHAWCGLNLAPMDNALIVVMDGGGCRSQWDMYPTHQEIESIYYGTKTNRTDIQPLYQKLSNQRFVHDISDVFPNELHGFLHTESVDHVNLEDVDYEFVSYPSMGMNFSNVSQALGTDAEGRAAGKVMGMASYGKKEHNHYNKFNYAHQLELDSYVYTKRLIEKAIEYKPDCKNIILSGGFSLNCTNNYKYLQAFPDYQIFVDPIPHDGGTAAGAALEMYQEMVDGMGETTGDREYCKPSVWSES